MTFKGKTWELSLGWRKEFLRQPPQFMAWHGDVLNGSGLVWYALLGGFQMRWGVQEKSA